MQNSLLGDTTVQDELYVVPDFDGFDELYRRELTPQGETRAVSHGLGRAATETVFVPRLW
jgi:hypothetical protein